MAHREYLFGEATAAWVSFETGFRARLEGANSPTWAAPGFGEALLRSVLRDTAGYAGTETIRRVMGFAHVADLEGIKDEGARLGAERLALAAGRDLIVAAGDLRDFAGLERIVRQRL